MQATTLPTTLNGNATVLITDNLESGSAVVMDHVEMQLVKGPHLELGVPPGHEYFYIEWKYSGKAIKRQHFNSTGVRMLRQLLVENK